MVSSTINVWVVNFVCLWFFKKCTFVSFGVKISNLIVGVMDITYTTESMKITYVGFPFLP